MISPKISKKSISILGILILIAFLSYQFLPRIYIVLATRAHFSKDKTPLDYIVPISRKFIDVTDIAHNKINYGNCELYLPWSVIKNTATEKTLVLTVRKGKGMLIQKDELLDDKGSALNNYTKEIMTFDGYNKILYTTPDQINLSTPYEVSKEKASLLILKAIFTAYDKRLIYRFEGKNIKGFQFGDPNESNFVIVDFFDNNSNLYHLKFYSFSQKEIDFILFSLRCGNEESK